MEMSEDTSNDNSDVDVCVLSESYMSEKFTSSNQSGSESDWMCDSNESEEKHYEIDESDFRERASELSVSFCL